jgi:hypothetical protein
MKALSSSLVGALALLVLALGVPHPVGAAESPEAVAAAEVSADAVTLVAGPELFCHNCYNSHFSCTEEDEPLLLTWQDWGPEDARVLAVGGFPECVGSGDDLCEDLIAGNCSEESEWDEKDAEVAMRLEAAVEAVDYSAAASLLTSHAHVGTYIAEREILVIHASACVGGVAAVLGVDQSFGSFL